MLWFVLNRYNNTSSVSGMLIQLGWYTLQIRRQALRLCMMYKLHNGLADLGTQQLMRPQRRPSRHVNCMGYEVPFSRTNYHQMSFVPRTVRDWNSLPDSVVLALSLGAFKDRLWYHFANSH